MGDMILSPWDPYLLPAYEGTIKTSEAVGKGLQDIGQALSDIAFLLASAVQYRPDFTGAVKRLKDPMTYAKAAGAIGSGIIAVRALKRIGDNVGERVSEEMNKGVIYVSSDGQD